MKKSTLLKWEKIIEEYEDSGLTAKEFCDKTGVNANSLRHRIQDLKSVPNQISEIMIVDEPCVVDSVNLTINGIQLKFDPSLDESVLATIIKVCGKM